MLAQIISSVLHVLLCYYFVIVKQLGATGIGIATLITFTNNFVLTLVFALLSPKVREILRWPDSTVFSDLGPFLSKGVYSTIILCSEWWAFEVATIFAGIIGIKELGAQTIITSLNMLLMMFPIGFQQIFSAMYGAAIGENNVKLASAQ